MLDRVYLMDRFWAAAKADDNRVSGKPYSRALNHVFNLIEQQEKNDMSKNVFVPDSPRVEQKVSLDFVGSECHVCVNGVRVLYLVDNVIVLHRFVSEAATGLAVDARGCVKVRS